MVQVFFSFFRCYIMIKPWMEISVFGFIIQSELTRQLIWRPKKVAIPLC